MYVRRAQRSSKAQRGAPGEGTALEGPGEAQHQLPVCCSSQRINRIPGCMDTGAACKSSIFTLNDISNKISNKIE